jgi:hypothetical protein
MKYKNVYIGHTVPKAIQKAINKQCHGKTGYRISVKFPIPRKIKEYYDRILSTPDVGLDWFKLKEKI